VRNVSNEQVLAAATDKLLVAGYHLPFPGIGSIEKAGSGYRFLPDSWKPVL
jgi:hypothetical protein